MAGRQATERNKPRRPLHHGAPPEEVQPMTDENPGLGAAPARSGQSDGCQHPQPATTRAVRRAHRCDSGATTTEQR
jgi:hypothetical protein